MSNRHNCKDSSSVKYIDYHDNTNTLEIGFHANDAVYHYPDCPKEEYHALKEAASVGSHFHKNIRRYKSIKVK